MKLRYKILLSLLILLLIIVFGPRRDYQKNNEFIKENDVLVIAHAGGKGHYPGNTWSAFEYSYNLGVDVLELDVHLTEDNILVTRHGENETGNIRYMSNCDTVIWEETYEYLYNNCNFGYNFEEDGEYPYRDMTHSEWVDAGVYMMKLEELFDAYGDTILYNIEIKADANAPREATADALYDLINEYELFDEVLVATSFEDISLYVALEYPELNLSTSHNAAQTFIIHSYTFSSVFYNPEAYSTLQLPTSFNVAVIGELDLSTKILINNAHRHNMAIHYWTINDPDTMRFLIEQGADGIITDYPDLLIEIINE